uniref:Fibrinogen-like protein 1 n=1 Tax=Drosophila rhopaloa TaxID=1041015 RepID=A0A6P4FKG1_DRORH
MEKTKSELSSQLSECRKSDENVPDSCPSGSRNWIYQIKVRGLEPFKVPCSKALPGWTVIQRRIDGSENFNRTWVEYKNGFGDIYIKLGKVDGSTSYAHYDDFKIGTEKKYYKLKN